MKLLPSARSREHETGAKQGQNSNTTGIIGEMLASAADPDQAVEMVTPAMAAKIAVLTGVDVSSLDEDTPLESIGMEARDVSTLAHLLANKSPFYSQS